MGSGECGEERRMSVNEEAAEDTALAGAGGDDLSAGTSVSGVGGQALSTENRQAGLAPVAERAAEVGWGRGDAGVAEQPVAGHDGTGQSEKPED
jgi:hypothetical protein